MELIEFNGKSYPHFQAEGNATQFAIAYAKHFCKGNYGYDIGGNKAEWALPGAILIDPLVSVVWDAYNLPYDDVDYIYSSHCLEHLSNWNYALEYWLSCLKDGGHYVFILTSL